MAVLTIWSSAKKAEIHRHDLDDGAHAGDGCTDAGTDITQFGQRRVADAVFAQFFGKTLGDGVAAAVARHVLAHQEHSLVGEDRRADRLLARLSIGHAHCGT